MGCERCEAHSHIYTSRLTVTSSMPRPASKKFSSVPGPEAPSAGFSSFAPVPGVTRSVPVTRFVTRRLPLFVTESRV
jgi:hypothetical protein